MDSGRECETPTFFIGLEVESVGVSQVPTGVMTAKIRLTLPKAG